jgi:hypothetical protein
LLATGQALKTVFATCVVVLLLFTLACATTEAQETPSPAAETSALANPPEPPQAQIPSAAAPRAITGNISGTVLDTNKNVVQGASVKLTAVDAFLARTVKSGANGQFQFNELPPGSYRITVTAPAMGAFTSAPIPLHATEAFILPPVALAVARATTSVTVNGNSQELSVEQEQIAVKQRVVGVFPNFYSTYDWNAPPMLTKQKFQLSIRSILDPISFLAVAGIAGAEQYRNIFPDYGGGIEGYGKRYGAAMANHVSSDLLGRAVFPVIFHQDPRYFYKGSGSIRSRAFYAISSSVIARGDDGRLKPYYSKLLGNFSAAALSNLYYPASDRGASLVLFNGLSDTGVDAVANLVREFVLKRFTSHIPNGANGKP